MTIKQEYVYTPCHRADKRENTNNDPQGMSSLFGNISGGEGVTVGRQHYVLTKKA